LECGRQGTQQENMDTTTRFVYHLSWSNQYKAFLLSGMHIYLETTSGSLFVP
jgi:hypothetical protein